MPLTTRIVVLLVAGLLLPFAAKAVTADNLRFSKKRRALIIGLDGTTGNQLHYRVWKQNKAPFMRELMSQGQYTICENDHDTRCAKTHSGYRYQRDFQWLTGPGWASVVTGADTHHHQIKDNDDESFRVFSSTSKNYPSLFKRAKDHGLKTAAAGVGAFLTSHQDDDLYYGILDYECGFRNHGPAVDPDATETCNLNHRKSLNSDDPARDEKLTSWFQENINDSSVDIIMGVFDLIDSSGHSHGFDNNSRYLQAITTADAQIGRILSTLKIHSVANNEEWLVLLTSDHGGHRIFAWGQHGTILYQDEVIPFVVAAFSPDGPYKLRPLTYPVTHMDTHPTVMQWFDIASPQTDGRSQGL